MNAPPYVVLPGSATYPPPIAKIDCDANICVLGAKRKELQETIDQWLNLPFNEVYDYVPLPWVWMFNMPIKEVRHVGAEPGGPWCGYATETDVAFAVMLAAVRKSPWPQKPVVDHFSIAFPFILVDNPVGLTTGREIWGFRQALGIFECVPGTTMPIAASTLVMTHYATDCEQSLQEVMRMDGLVDDLALAPGHSVLADIEHLTAVVLDEGESLLERLEEKVLDDAAKWVLRHSLDARLLLKELAKILPQRLKINCAFLMQMRDVAAPDYASYQSVIEAPLKFTQVMSCVEIPATPMTLSDYPSYPLVKTLGIISESSDGPHHRVKPLAAFQVKFSLDVMPGRVIAEAGRVMMGASGMPFWGYQPPY